MGVYYFAQGEIESFQKVHLFDYGFKNTRSRKQALLVTMNLLESELKSFMISVAVSM